MKLVATFDIGTEADPVSFMHELLKRNNEPTITCNGCDSISPVMIKLKLLDIKIRQGKEVIVKKQINHLI